MSKARVHYHAGEEYEGGEIFFGYVGLCGNTVAQTTKDSKWVNCSFCLKQLAKPEYKFLKGKFSEKTEKDNTE